MNTKEKKLKSINDLRLRILKLKARMPYWMYGQAYQDEFGVVSESEINRIRMVWNLRLTDEKITTNLELLADKLKQI